MPVVINGSTGISGTDGSAGAPAIQGTDTNTGMFFPAADQIAFAEGGVEAMRIDASGNVGIGTTTPSERLTVVAASGVQIGVTNGTITQRVGYCDFGNAFSGTASNHPYVLLTNDVERARITTAGRVGIKNTAPTSLLTINTTSDTENITKLTINGYGDFRGVGCVMQPNNDTNCVPFIFTNSAGATVGSITTNASNTGFNTSSDYRLKHNAQPLTAGLATIGALKPSTYKWNADGSHGEGFIAHELAEHIPLAVSGEKDAVNEDGSIRPQGVDYSKMVVHLVAAVQELTAKLEAAEARIATLEVR
jgi:hypothetical protein